ncbi:hypothetical protein [Pseudooceanicola sp. MF1-13]|uniref:hypothetical protein n=1 Tax=Pseudooceanicola sp. MF1-13 TaxID=3379095 RepID=UPI0038927583
MSQGLIRHIAPWAAEGPAWIARTVFGASRFVRIALGFAMGLLLADRIAPDLRGGIAMAILVVAVIWVVLGRVLMTHARRQLTNVLNGTEPLKNFRLIGTGTHMVWIRRKGF